jgi:hypothetical protein
MFLGSACVGELQAPAGGNVGDDVVPDLGGEVAGPTASPGFGAAKPGVSSQASSLRFSCTAPELRAHGQQSMRRLTRDELFASFEALVGPAVMHSIEVEAVASQIPAESEGDVVHELQNGHSFDHAQGLFNLTRAISMVVGADLPARARILGECAGSADDACAAAFLDKFSVRVLKRPLPAERRAALLSGFVAMGRGIEAMRALLAALMQSPEAVFQLDMARDDQGATAGRIAVDDWTVASRLSYGLTGRGPDDALLDAASRGELRTVEQVRPHAERLIDTQGAREQLKVVLDSWLQLRKLPDPTEVVAESAGIDPVGLGAEARTELLDFVDHVVFRESGDLPTLLSSRVGFPRSPRMATLYGSAVAGEQPVELPNGHRGLLLRVAPMLSGQRSTSPITRGVYVRKRLLCETMPSPDFSIISARSLALEAADPAKLSTREIVTEITSPNGCMSCHSLINPVGFALESFDPLGRVRKAETAYDAMDHEVAQHPLNTAVTVTQLSTTGPLAIDGSEQLSDALMASNEIYGCVAERLVSTARLRPLTPADECTAAEVERALHEGKSIKEAWLRSVVNEDLFYRKAE